jgi:hypothetical protein
MALSSPPLGCGLFIPNQSFTGQADRSLPGLDFWQIESSGQFIGFESRSKGRYFCERTTPVSLRIFSIRPSMICLALGFVLPI